jgi:hypothetical protein
VMEVVLRGCGWFVEQKLMLSSNFRYDKIHKIHFYEFEVGL